MKLRTSGTNEGAWLQRQKFKAQVFCVLYSMLPCHLGMRCPDLSTGYYGIKTEVMHVFFSVVFLRTYLTSNSTMLPLGGVVVTWFQWASVDITKGSQGP